MLRDKDCSVDIFLVSLPNIFGTGGKSLAQTGRHPAEAPAREYAKSNLCKMMSSV